ncbi:uncharacterized protein L199_001973 [Kwoniella botswanensis]|uniref:uncharacterized protein n=1 Tax=Kwoniella botswanensis TaxID=1268659 RepID=UPI00315DF218
MQPGIISPRAGIDSVKPSTLVFHRVSSHTAINAITPPYQTTSTSPVIPLPPLSLVLKIMKPMSFKSSGNSEDDEESSFGALSYHPAEYKDADAAVKAAYNEDIMYHHLLNFQGTVLPNYHGLFVWPSSDEDDTQVPGLMAMLLEDLGAQIPPEDMDSIDVSEEECKQIRRIYDQLHDEAKIVHVFPQLWHILRRKEIKPGDPNHLVVIDFANARSLSDEALSEKQRGRLLKLDTCRLGMSFSTHKW